MSHFPPPYGGLAVHSARLVAALEQRGWRVERLSPPDASLARGSLRRLRIVSAQLRFLAQILRTRCNLVHDHISTYSIGPPGLAGGLIALALLASLRSCGRPWVVTSGKGRLRDELAAAPGWIRRGSRWLYRGAAHAIAKSPAIERAFEDLGLEDRVSVIGTFLEPARRDDPLPGEVEAFLASHPLCVATAGFAFAPLYNLPAVVAAVAFLRRRGPSRGLPSEIGLVLLASSVEDPSGYPAFTRALAEHEMDPHTLVLRDVDFALEVTARCRVLVRATDSDGDANTVKEAMRVGVPVVATDLPGRPPGIHTVERGELSELGARLLEILVTPDEAQLQANRAWVEQDIERNTSAILAVYAQVQGR